MNRTFLAVALSVALVACSSDVSTTPEAGRTRARGATTEAVAPRTSTPSLPASASLARTDLDNPTFPATATAPAARPGLSLRVDASSAEALIASLQRAESTLSPRDLERLRAALTVVQMLMSRKVAALAVADPSQANLDDDQLLKLAFGDIHGKTVQEVIDYGIRMAPVVAPDGSVAGAFPAGGL